jgi:protein disulfide-isomerase
LSTLASLAAADTTFPDPLTISNFPSKLSHGLHLVEFYSPYCSHCKHFAPTWESTWDAFHEEGDSLGIGMVQVDCVTSGDLCNQEKITAYPSIKLYGPKGFIKNFPRAGKRTQEGLIKFMRDSVSELGDPDFHVSSKSKLISTDEMIKVLGEVQGKPYLVSFWPSYELTNLDEYNVDKFDTSYDEDCLDIQRTWNIVSNQVSSMGVETRHFNCLKNKKICEKLGYTMDIPYVALFLPDMRVAKLITLDHDMFDLNVKNIVDFTSRTLKAATVQDINIEQLSELIPPHMSFPQHFPTESQTVFVYIYDPETSSHEDFEIFPYLIEPLSKLPNARLYKSNNTDILKLIDVQKKNLYDNLNYITSEPHREFNEQRHTIETMTSFPCLVALHDNTQWPQVYQNFGPNEIRDQYRLISFMNEQSAPQYMEFKGDNQQWFLDGPDHNERVVLIALAPQDEKMSLEYQQNFLIGIHDYADLRDQYRYEKIIRDRKLKQEKAELLKSKHAAAKDVVKELQKEVYYDNSGQLTLGWFDIKNGDVLKRLGYNVDGREYSAGDVIVIDRSKNQYYERDTLGDILNVRESPYNLRVLLTSAQGITHGKIISIKCHSMFSTNWRILDDLLGLLNIWSILLVSGLGVVLLKVRKTKKATDSRGILGNPDAKAD